MHHERSLSPIPRSQDWACGPSAFLYIPKDYLLDYLLDYFSEECYVFLNFLFLIFLENEIYFSKPMRLTIF